MKQTPDGRLLFLTTLMTRVTLLTRRSDTSPQVMCRRRIEQSGFLTFISGIFALSQASRTTLKPKGLRNALKLIKDSTLGGSQRMMPSQVSNPSTRLLARLKRD